MQSKTKLLRQSNQLEDIELEIEALNLAQQLDCRPRRSDTKN